MLNSALDWLGNVPSWAKTIGSILGALGGAYAYFSARRDKSIDERRSIEYEWCKAILFDQVVPQLLSFLAEQRSVFEGIASDEKRKFVPSAYDSALVALKLAKRRLERRLLILKALSQSRYDDMQGFLDEIDDALTVHCAANSGAELSERLELKTFANTDKEIARLTVDLFLSLKKLHGEVEEQIRGIKFMDWIKHPWKTCGRLRGH